MTVKAVNQATIVDVTDAYSVILSLQASGTGTLTATCHDTYI